MNSQKYYTSYYSITRVKIDLALRPASRFRTRVVKKMKKIVLLMYLFSFIKKYVMIYTCKARLRNTTSVLYGY